MAPAGRNGTSDVSSKAQPETGGDTGGDTGERIEFHKYDRRSLTYANSFDSPATSRIIRGMEWLTGKISIIRMIRAFEKSGAPSGQAFWRAALDIMRIPLLTPDAQIANIPAEGPVVVVANHPHGLVDGMILAELIGRRRTDYKLLTRSLLTGIDEVAASYMIPVPFPHDPEAQRKSVEMRASAMAHLREGGVISVFPSGMVSSSDTLFGPVVEREWNVFTAQMIRRSGAQVVPIFFPGSNSRWYQMANCISPTMRQGLLLHEVVRSCGKPQKPVVGAPIPPERMKTVETDPRGFMHWLRAHTLSLGDGQG